MTEMVESKGEKVNWAERACRAAQLVDHDADMIGDADYADGYVDGVVAGARWQREQLRSGRL